MSGSDGGPERLLRENLRLSKERDLFLRYIREKTDELLVLMECPTLNADAVGDMELIVYDPIGTIASSFGSVLRNLKETNERLRKEAAERERIEAELLKAEKLESIGVLAGGIAHDFNNLLTGILGNISMAQIRADSPEEIRENLSRAEKVCVRARELTRHLLTFSKGGAPVRKSASIGEIISGAAEVSLPGSNVRCDVDPGEDTWPVHVDVAQIGQVFSNLIINAVQAMPDGGVLGIRAENVPAGDPIPPLLAPGSYVRVSFTDTGVGIPKELLAKIFDPFFTTKEKGSGLGLATAYSVLKQHDGMITVTSEPGKGSTFSVFLPAFPEGTARRKDAAAPASMKARILVMDDEETVREIAIEFLEHLGYEGVGTGSGQEALEAYREASAGGRPFSAVIMDLTIPGGMGGKEAVRRLLEFDPVARAIVSSGYSTDPVMAEYEKHGFSGVIAKPYRMDELKEVLNTVLRPFTVPEPGAV